MIDKRHTKLVYRRYYEQVVNDNSVNNVMNVLQKDMMTKEDFLEDLLIDGLTHAVMI